MLRSMVSIAFAVICIFLLAGCGRKPDSPDVVTPTAISVMPEIKIADIGDTKVESITIREETVDQPNCGGTDGVETEIRRSRTIARTIELGTGLEIDTRFGVNVAVVEASVGAAVASKLGYTFGESEELSRAVTVKAAANTSMRHSVRQREIWDVGDIEISIGDHDLTIPFRFRSDFAVELVGSENIGCPTNTPQATNTATQTATPASTPTPPPTNTSTPTSTPNSIPTQRATSTPTLAESVVTPTESSVDAPETQITAIPVLTDRSVLPVCPERIQFGDVIRCSIGSPGETHAYTFEADVDDIVRIVMVRVSDALEPEFTVTHSDGGWTSCIAKSTKVATNECRMNRTDTYTITTSDQSDRDKGEYILSLQRLNDPAGSIAIDFGQTVTGSINLPMEYDFYTFFGDVGDMIVITMARSNSILEPEYTMYDEGGGWTSCRGKSTKITQGECRLSNAGQYTIQVNDQSDRDEGSYILRLQKLNSPAGAVPIDFGQTLEGRIDSTAEEDFYTFSADVDDRIVITMRRSTGVLEPSFRVYTDLGEWTNCIASSATVAEANCRIGHAGNYAIRATDGSDKDSGEYTLTLQKQ